MEYPDSTVGKTSKPKKIQISFSSSSGPKERNHEVWVGNHLLFHSQFLKSIQKLIDRSNPKPQKRSKTKGQSQSNKKSNDSLKDQFTDVFSHSAKNKLFIFCDEKLNKEAHLFKNQLLHLNWKVKVFSLEVQEKLKDFNSLSVFYHQLLEAEADRSSILLALGGGVVGDIVGFIAATYLRGVRWMNIPTTLLAQVDSGIGGKTGVNHSHGKNLIGAFHQPIVVLCDVSLLESLEMRDRISGLGEMIKYGLIYDPSFFALLEKNWTTLLGFHSYWDSEALKSAIFRCVQLKVQAVQKDEYDQLGIREVLNFGHTVGHALEAVCGYGYYRHGEAVIQGMRAAIWLSRKLVHLSHPEYFQIEGFLSRIPVPAIPKKLKIDRFLAFLKSDKKKSSDGKIRFVLLKSMGKTTSQPVDLSDVLDALQFLSAVERPKSPRS